MARKSKLITKKKSMHPEYKEKKECRMEKERQQRVYELLKRGLKLIEDGDELPVEWAREFFPPERREYELIYHGKESEEKILSEAMAVPLQPVSTFGTNGIDWHNMLILGDNLQAMKTLLQLKESGELINADGMPGVRLIYIDPPFSTKRDFRGSQDQKVYQDKIAGAEFLEFLRKRLVCLKELLSDNGAIFIHLDYRKKHYIKVLMDEIFGENNFRNEIAVNRIKKNVRERERVKKLNEEFDTILFYSKNEKLLVLPPMRKDTKPDRWHAFDAAGFRNNMDYEIFGFKPATSRHWHWSKDKAFEAKKNYEEWEKKFSNKEPLGQYWQRLEKKLQFVRANPNTGKPEYFIPASEESLCNNLWNDISAYSFSHNYPTEKNETLLSRIIGMASAKGDLILDCFAGSGTTLSAAEKLERRWIGIDCGKLAIYTVQKRMLNLCSEIGNSGKSLAVKPFTLYNAGLYDFETLRNLDWNDWRFFALQLFECKDELHKIRGFQMDGKRQGSSVLVFNHFDKGTVSRETITDIHASIGKQIGERCFIIAPRGAFLFQEDYIELDAVRYYALRIPYSYINELHRREFSALIQPSDETAVNETVEAVGFDFIQPPLVELELKMRTGVASIKIKKFESRARLRGEEKISKHDALSMVMVDFEYNGKVFDLDKVFYADALKNNSWKIEFPLKDVTGNVMLVFLDIYGNESRMILEQKKLTGKPKQLKRRSHK